MSRFLTSAEIIEIHREMLRRFGGAPGVRDAAALEAAAGRPQSGYYEDVIAEAAALFESLSQDHPFFDGNKRTAFSACAMAAYSAGTVNRDNVERWLRSHAQSM